MLNQFTIYNDITRAIVNMQWGLWTLIMVNLFKMCTTIRFLWESFAITWHGDIGPARRLWAVRRFSPIRRLWAARRLWAPTDVPSFSYINIMLWPCKLWHQTRHTMYLCYRRPNKATGKEYHRFSIENDHKTSLFQVANFLGQISFCSDQPVKIASHGFTKAPLNFQMGQNHKLKKIVRFWHTQGLEQTKMFWRRRTWTSPALVFRKVCWLISAKILSASSTSAIACTACALISTVTWFNITKSLKCFVPTFADAIGENDDGIVELGVLCSDCTVDFGCVFNRRSIRYHENDFVCNSMYLFSTSRKRHNAWVALDSCFDRNFVCFATDTDLHFQIPGVTREGTLAIRASP